jgi:uncharacterized protein YgiM (DUF1202 family)
MNKKTKLALLFGVPIIIGGYFIFKQLKPKPNPAPPKPVPPPPPPEAECSDYKVTTVSSNLNIRSSASTTSTIVGSLAKDSIVSVKASSTEGWMQLCDNGNGMPLPNGYVASLYLTKSASFSGGIKGLKF